MSRYSEIQWTLNMRCIFCLKEREPSIEHVFPEAIGGTLTIDRVCKPCNDRLGSDVDVLLTNNELVTLKRFELGMRDRAGNLINPWAKVFREGTLASDPEQKVQIVADPVTGQLQPRLIHKAVRTRGEDGTEIVQITIDASKSGEIGKIIQRERRRAGLSPLSDDELQKQVAAVKEQMGSIEQPEVLHRVAVDIHEFKRGICKIVYELAWLWLGDEYLDDPTARQLRNMVLSGTQEDVKGHIQLGRAEPPFSLWNDEPNAHIALGRINGSSYLIGVRIFDLFSGVLCMTDTPNRYSTPSQSKFLLIDVAGSRSRSTSLEDEIARLTRPYA